MSLSLRDVARRVNGEAHLSGIALDLQPGLTVLLGRTTSGKTSLLRLMAGLDRPSEGRVLDDGKDVTGVPVNKRNVAVVYQQFVNYPSFTVFDNIASPLRRQGVGRSEIEDRVRAVARTVRIDHLLDRLPAQLSGGQQQRVAIARALVKNAKLLLLDEPLVNLDFKLREELRSELRALFKGGERVVVYATTEPEEALQMGGRTIVLHEGRVLQTGATEAVHREPGSTTVAGIVSEPPINIVAGRIAEGTIHVAGRALPTPPHLAGRLDGACRIGVRPHSLSVTAAPGLVPLGGSVTLTEVDGSSTVTHFTAAGENWILQREGVHPAPSGTAVDAYLDPADLYLFDADGALVAAPARRAA